MICLCMMALPSAKHVSKEAPTPYPKKTFLALVEEKLPLLAIAAASAAMTMKAAEGAVD